jgi:hypothetical protein
MLEPTKRCFTDRFRPDRLKLAGTAPAGGSLDAVSVVESSSGELDLK